MAKGSEIIVTSPARGRFMEGYVNAALVPGVVVQIDVSEGIGGDARGHGDVVAQVIGRVHRVVVNLGQRCRVDLLEVGEDVPELLDELRFFRLGQVQGRQLGDFLDVGQGDDRFGHEAITARK